MEKRRKIIFPHFCPALRAGFFNPLTRKIVFVRASVRPSVSTPFPYYDFATFHFLFGNRRNRRFSNKKCVASLRPTSYLKSDDFGRKYAILQLTSYLKSDDFGRKYAISQSLLDMRPALRAGLSGGSSLGQRPATLFIRCGNIAS